MDHFPGAGSAAIFVRQPDVGKLSKATTRTTLRFGCNLVNDDKPQKQETTETEHQHLRSRLRTTTETWKGRNFSGLPSERASQKSSEWSWIARCWTSPSNRYQACVTFAKHLSQCCQNKFDSIYPPAPSLYPLGIRWQPTGGLSSAASKARPCNTHFCFRTSPCPEP